MSTFPLSAVSQAVQHAAQKTNTFYTQQEARVPGAGLPTGTTSVAEGVGDCREEASSDPTPTASKPRGVPRFRSGQRVAATRHMYASQKMRSFNSGSTMQCTKVNSNALSGAPTHSVELQQLRISEASCFLKDLL